MGHKNKEGGRKQAGGEASASASAAKAKAPLPAPSVSFNPKDVTDPLELLDMCVAALHDKSASAATREAALASLVGALEGGVVPLDEATDGRPLVIFAVCGVSIKKGTAAPALAKEARLACRAVGLLALTLHGGGSTEILAESFPMLARTLAAPSPSSVDTTTAAAVLDCLAAVTFAGALGTEDAERSLKAIWGVVCPNPSSSRSPKNLLSGKASPHPQVVAAALSTWTFLLTTATITDAQRKAEGAAWTSTVASLAGLLHADDRAVRMAAGEALAVCVELNLTQHAPRKDMEAVRARVSDLAAEAGGRGADSKALLAEQKELFRQVGAYLERGERPSKAVQTSSDRRRSIRASTWAKMVQLKFLRRFLAGGFLSHVKGNRLFRECFDAGADERSTLSIARRKLSLKTKDRVMKMNRELAWAAKNVYCSSIPQGGPAESNRPEQLLKLGWH